MEHSICEDHSKQLIIHSHHHRNYLQVDRQKYSDTKSGAKFCKKLGIKHVSSKQIIKQKTSCGNNVGGLPHGVFHKYTKIPQIQKY